MFHKTEMFVFKLQGSSTMKGTGPSTATDADPYDECGLNLGTPPFLPCVTPESEIASYNSHAQIGLARIIMSLRGLLRTRCYWQLARK
jgi:hypothetical protein